MFRIIILILVNDHTPDLFSEEYISTEEDAYHTYASMLIAASESACWTEVRLVHGNYTTARTRFAYTTATHVHSSDVMVYCPRCAGTDSICEYPSPSTKCEPF